LQYAYQRSREGPANPVGFSLIFSKGAGERFRSPQKIQYTPRKKNKNVLIVQSRGRNRYALLEKSVFKAPIITQKNRRGTQKGKERSCGLARALKDATRVEKISRIER